MNSGWIERKCEYVGGAHKFKAIEEANENKR